MKTYLIAVALSLVCAVVQAQSLEQMKQEEKALKLQVQELKNRQKKEKLEQNIAKLRLQLATLREADGTPNK